MKKILSILMALTVIAAASFPVSASALDVYSIIFSGGQETAITEKAFLFLSDSTYSCNVTDENGDTIGQGLDFDADEIADAELIIHEPANEGDESTYGAKLFEASVGKFTEFLVLTVSDDESADYFGFTTVHISFEMPIAEECFTVTVTAEAGGTVTGGGIVTKGNTTQVTATPNAGYQFDGWYEGTTKVSSDASYSFTATKNVTLTAKFAVLADAATIEVSKKTTVTYNIGKNIPITVKDAYGKPMAQKDVYLTIDNKTVTLITNNKGIAVYNNAHMLAPKAYQITVTCGDASKKVALTVKKGTPKIMAYKKTFKAATKVKKYSVTLKNNKGKAMKNEKVTLKCNKKTYTAKTNKKGVATFKITKATKKGNYTVTVKFTGNKYYSSITKKAQIIIKK